MQYAQDVQDRWKLIARMQGLVCVVCGDPPELQNRGAFYDSGLCDACAAELQDGELSRLDAPPELA